MRRRCLKSPKRPPVRYAKSSMLSGVDEIMVLDGHVVVYRNNTDLFFYIVGSIDENELILANILSTFYETASILLKCALDILSVSD